MATIIAQSSGSTQRELIPAGNHVARCYQMIDIGSVDESFNGETKHMHKVSIGFELPNETRVFKQENGEQPFVVSKEYTLSLHEKSRLRQDLKSWRGKDFTDKEAEAFDIAKLLGVPCMLNVIHVTAKNGNTYAQISGITPVPKGLVCPPQVNKNQLLAFDEFNEELFNGLPDFLKDKIKSSDEYKALKNPEHFSFVDDKGQPKSDLPWDNEPDDDTPPF